MEKLRDENISSQKKVLEGRDSQLHFVTYGITGKKKVAIEWCTSIPMLTGPIKTFIISSFISSESVNLFIKQEFFLFLFFYLQLDGRGLLSPLSYRPHFSTESNFVFYRTKIVLEHSTVSPLQMKKFLLQIFF